MPKRPVRANPLGRPRGGVHPAPRDRDSTLGFLIITWFVGRPGIVVFGGFGRPRRPNNIISEGGGRTAPPSGMVFGAAGAAQTPNIDDFRPAPFRPPQQRRVWARLGVARQSYLTVLKFWIVVERRRHRPRIVRNPCVPVCGYRACDFGLILSQL